MIFYSNKNQTLFYLRLDSKPSTFLEHNLSGLKLFSFCTQCVISDRLFFKRQLQNSLTIRTRPKGPSQTFCSTRQREHKKRRGVTWSHLWTTNNKHQIDGFDKDCSPMLDTDVPPSQLASLFKMDLRNAPTIAATSNYTQLQIFYP